MKKSTEKNKELSKVLKSDFVVTMKKATQIKPYWRNARDNADTVEAVKESMKTYGVTTPILIDQKDTIIAGHARYKAMLELGYENIPCFISKMNDKQAKEYRIVDNKTAEMTSYIEDQLTVELREIGNIDFMQQFFPSMNLEIMLDTSIGGSINYEDQDEIDHKKELMDSQFSVSDKETKGQREVICPHCGEIYFID